MSSNEEPVFGHIENLLEAESMSYASSSSSSSTSRGTNMQASDWKNKMNGPSFQKKTLRKTLSAPTPYEEDYPLDESLPFDESFSGMGHLDDSIERENMEPVDPFNMHLPVMKEEEEEPYTLESEEEHEEEDDEEETSCEESNASENEEQEEEETSSQPESPSDLMNEVVIADEDDPAPAQQEESIDCSIDRSMERSMEIAVSDVYDELSGIVETTPVKSPRDEESSEQPTQDQQFVMDILAAPADTSVESPSTSFVQSHSPVQSKNVAVRASRPFDEGSVSPYCQDEMAELDQALKTMTLSTTPTKLVEEEPVNSPYKKDLIAMEPTPITPPPNHHHHYDNNMLYMDPYQDSDDEEEGIVRIRLSEEDVYGNDIPAKYLAEHPVLMKEHDFNLHRNVQVNAMDTFRDEEGEEEESNNNEASSDTLEARVMNVLSPLRNMLTTPQKWKGSPKTPATVGESPPSSRDVETGTRGDAIIRSNLAQRFQVAFGMDSDESDEEFIDWKDRYCTKRQIYLWAILVVLVIIFICVIIVMVGMQNNKATGQQGMNDFYKITEDGGH